MAIVAVCAFIWWLGMMPTAYLVGKVDQAQRARLPAKPLTDGQRIIGVIIWPLLLVYLPVSFFYDAAMASKPKAKRDGKAK